MLRTSQGLRSPLVDLASGRMVDLAFRRSVDLACGWEVDLVFGTAASKVLVHQTQINFGSVGGKYGRLGESREG